MLCSEEQITHFFGEQQPRAMAYLRKTFTTLSKEDCEDLVQQAAIELWEQSKTGRLDELTASLSTYYCGICRTFALALLKKRKASPVVPIEEICQTVDADDGQRRVEYLIRLEEETQDASEALSRRKDALVRQIVRSLPSPCDKLLWGRYRDGLSMSLLATLCHYATETVARVTSHKCRMKFAARYAEEVKKILD